MGQRQDEMAKRKLTTPKSNKEDVTTYLDRVAREKLNLKANEKVTAKRFEKVFGQYTPKDDSSRMAKLATSNTRATGTQQLAKVLERDLAAGRIDMANLSKQQAQAVNILAQNGYLEVQEFTISMLNGRDAFSMAQQILDAVNLQGPTINQTGNNTNQIEKAIEAEIRQRLEDGDYSANLSILVTELPGNEFAVNFKMID
jgi:hypothetical protein